VLFKKKEEKPTKVLSTQDNPEEPNYENLEDTEEPIKCCETHYIKHCNL